MSTKRTMTSEHQKKTTKPSRKKYKEAKKTAKSKSPAKQDSRRPKAGASTSVSVDSGARGRSEAPVTSGKPSKATGETAKNRTRKEQKKLQKAEKKANKRPIRRIFPIWLRLIVIPLLCIGALLLGVMVGYGVIGDGNPMDALHKETWKHIMDIIDKK